MIRFDNSRRGRVAASAVAMSLAVSMVVHAQAVPQANINQIDQLIETYINLRAGFPMALGARVPAFCIGYIASGTQFSRRCAGETRMDSGSESVFPPATALANDQTIFRIGSLSKLFTASLLAARRLDAAGMIGGCSRPDALCYEEKLVSHLDLDMSSDCSRDCADKAAITLRQLATHQSKIPRNGTFFQVVPYDDLFLLADFGIVGLDPTSAYSNMGFALLAKALEDGSSSYRAQVKNRLLTPLEMAHTRVDPAASDFPQLAQAPGYQVGAADAWGPAFAGSGGYHSNLDDMMEFLRWHLGYVSVPSINAIRDETVVNRLGWGVSDWVPNHTTGDLVSKDGASTGFKVYIGYLRNTGRGVVVLLAGSDDPELIGTEVLKLLR